MRLLYNILQLIIAPLLFFIFPFFFLIRPEKSKTILNRLGIGLAASLKHVQNKPVIWIHALSVGEVVSVIPLVQAIRKSRPDINIIFSATTKSGKRLAHSRISSFVDSIIHFPLDIYPVVKYFINQIKPDLFILVETDFWPNLIHMLSSQNIPIILVNGRISEKSMYSYRKCAFFFKPMFNRFSEMCMQTTLDSDNMISLGVNKNTLKNPGNLKYALVDTTYETNELKQFVKVDHHLLFICGSTHHGEESIIMEAFKIVCSKHSNVHLLIAPRDITRAHELKTDAEDLGFTTDYFSFRPGVLPDCLIIDTIGDLAALYSLSDIAFIGGSLVELGGHNPLEAARQGIPTLFGPHMENFSEISRELLEHKASLQITDNQSLASELDNLISSEALRKETGNNGLKCLNLYKNVIEKHLTIIENHL